MSKIEITKEYGVPDPRARQLIAQFEDCIREAARRCNAEGSFRAEYFFIPPGEMPLFKVHLIISNLEDVAANRIVKEVKVIMQGGN